MVSTTLSALVVAAHPDDEVLGCGGTLAKLRATGWRTHVLVLAEGVTSRDPQRDASARADSLRELRSATHLAHELLGTTSVTQGQFPDNRMDSVDLLDVVKTIEKCIAETRPSRVYTHHSGDVNVDHRIAHEAVQAAVRPQPGACVRELFFYEIPSSTEWRASSGFGAFTPALFTDITDHLPAKQDALACYFDEMRDWPHPRSHEAIAALAAWRGASVGCAAAEAFAVGRIIN